MESVGNKSHSAIFSKHTQHTALNGYVLGVDVDGVHLNVGRLQSHLIALGVIALERGLGAMQQSHNDLTLSRRAGALHQNVVAVD